MRSIDSSIDTKEALIDTIESCYNRIFQFQIYQLNV